MQNVQAGDDESPRQMTLTGLFDSAMTHLCAGSVPSSFSVTPSATASCHSEAPVNPPGRSRGRVGRVRGRAPSEILRRCGCPPPPRRPSGSPTGGGPGAKRRQLGSLIEVVREGMESFSGRSAETERVTAGGGRRWPGVHVSSGREGAEMAAPGYGSRNRPAKRIVPESRSRMKKRKGRSARKSKRPPDVLSITTTVVAAASVPTSSTST